MMQAPPSSPGGGAGVILLKERNTKTNGQDAYEQTFAAAGYRPRFLAPLSFAFPPAAQAELVTLLQADPRSSGILALAATSPRGIDAFVAALAVAATAGGDPAAAGCERLRALWEGTTVFVVGAASAARLEAQDNLALRCGFHAEVDAQVKNAAEMGDRIRVKWSDMATSAPSPAAASAASTDAIASAAGTSTSPSVSTSPQRLLVLVGDRRRDELFNVLAGRAPDGSVTPAPNQGVNVPVHEIVVYQTLLAQSTTEDDTEQAEASAKAVSPFIRQLLAHLQELDATPTSAAARPSASSSSSSVTAASVFVVFFSPSGVETFFSQLQSHLQSPSDDIARGLATYFPRFRFACIGQTSAHAFGTQRQEAEGTELAWLQQTPPLLVAAKPNAEELLRCFTAATTSSVAASSPPPSFSAVTAASCVTLATPPLPPRATSIPFFKYHGTLNDYVLLDGFARQYTREQLVHIARSLCLDRRGAVGSDGLLYVTGGRETAAFGPQESSSSSSLQHIQGRMYMFNTDGSEAEMCGNGLRCVAKFVHDHKFATPRPSVLHLLTGAGEKIARILPNVHTGLAQAIVLDLGRPVMAPAVHSIHIPAEGSSPAFDLEGLHDVSMGNPHCIVLLPSGPYSWAEAWSPLQGQTIDQVDVPRLGKIVHEHERYRASGGVNISFVSIRPTTAFAPVSTSASALFSSAAAPSPTASAAPAIPTPILTVDIRTYERGNGETWSCGSGISASVCSVLARRSAAASSPPPSLGVPYQETVQVFVRGGELSVTCTLVDRAAPAGPAGTAAAAPKAPLILRDITRVELCGPATEVFQGSFSLII